VKSMTNRLASIIFEKKHMKGIYVKHNKSTENMETRTMKVPSMVYISMAQHIGVPAKPLVKPGDQVYVGQLIGDSDAFVSAPIHSSVSGIVDKIEKIRSATGGHDTLIAIKPDKKQTPWEGIGLPVVTNYEEFVRAIRNSGLVGLGGAAFPTHVKFKPKNLDTLNTLIINGAECEPFITSDYRTMLENTEDIMSGIELTAKYLSIEEVIIAIENNKPKAIALFNKIVKERQLKNIRVLPLNSSYPQGAERVLIFETTGKIMNAGVLPAELGVLVSNIATVAFIGQYFRTGMPLVSKKITVDGSAVKTPANLLVPIGAPIIDVIDACGGYRGKPEKILMGGPMMGRTVFSDSVPILKNNNAILAFTGKQAVIPEETHCINCGRCFYACPFDLMPYALSRAYDKKDAAELERLRVIQCMECGSCSYVCPANKPLSFTNKIGKELVKEAKK
jgi:Na+-translocating ferredoxin:NAD+ oxidoreductase subunit C